jgi:hypothetical protein
MSDIKSVLLEGKCRWASVQSPKDNFAGDGQEFSIDIECDAQTLADLQEQGLSSKKKLKETDDGRTFLTFKRPTMSKQGKELSPVAVVGPDLMPVSELIGNESLVKVKVDLIPYSNKFGTGHVARLVAVQVLDLVAYSAQSSTLEGFTAVGDDEGLI